MQNGTSARPKHIVLAHTLWTTLTNHQLLHHCRRGHTYRVCTNLKQLFALQMLKSKATPPQPGQVILIQIIARSWCFVHAHAALNRLTIIRKSSTVLCNHGA